MLQRMTSHRTLTPAKWQRHSRRNPCSSSISLYLLTRALLIKTWGNAYLTPVDSNPALATKEGGAAPVPSAEEEVPVPMSKAESTAWLCQLFPALQDISVL